MIDVTHPGSPCQMTPSVYAFCVRKFAKQERRHPAFLIMRLMLRSAARRSQDRHEPVKSAAADHVRIVEAGRRVVAAGCHHLLGPTLLAIDEVRNISLLRRHPWSPSGHPRT